MSDAAPHKFPLCWPAGKPRRDPHTRRISPFKVTFGKALDDLLRSVKMLKTENVILSSNVPLRRDGLPYAEDGDLDDPGIALYFKRKGKPICIACDVFRSPRENIRAIGLALDGLRSMERNGCGELMDQAFTGFLALPAKRENNWWEVLGVPATASTEEIKSAYRAKMREWHPDNRPENPEGAQTMSTLITQAYRLATGEPT